MQIFLRNSENRTEKTVYEGERTELRDCKALLWSLQILFLIHLPSVTNVTDLRQLFFTKSFRKIS